MEDQKTETQSEIKQEVKTEDTKVENKTVDETPEQINWRQFREERKKERIEKEAAEKFAKQKEQEANALKAAMDALLNKSSVQEPERQSVYGTDELSQEEIIERKVAENFQKHLRDHEEKKRIEEQQEWPKRIMKEHSDFNSVCTEENLDYLEYHYPEVAAPYKLLPDGYDKWSAIYKAVKRFVANPNSKKDSQKAEKNFTKPQSISVSGATPTGDTAPMMLDEKRKADNWARMQKRMKNIN